MRKEYDFSAARKNPYAAQLKKQIEQIAASIQQLGFHGALLVDEENRIVAGHPKRSLRPPPQPSLPAVRQAILDTLTKPPPAQCPHCRKIIYPENLPK